MYSPREKLLDEMDFWSDLMNTLQCRYCKFKKQIIFQRKRTTYYPYNFNNFFVVRINEWERVKQAQGILGLYCLLDLCQASRVDWSSHVNQASAIKSWWAVLNVICTGNWAVNFKVVKILNFNIFITDRHSVNWIYYWLPNSLSYVKTNSQVQAWLNTWHFWVLAARAVP